MKKLLVSLFYVFLAVAAQAQQYAVYATPSGVVKPLPNGQTVHVTAGGGGAVGQIQWNNAGLLDGFTMTGDMTVVPSTGIATIGAGVVSNSKLAAMPASTFKANSSGGSGTPSDLTVSQAKTLLSISTSDVSGLGSMALQSSGSISVTGGTESGVDISGGTISGAAISGGTITGLPSPSLSSDAATKAYVDGVASGIVQRTGVTVATTANITLSGEQTIDGILTSSTRIMVKNQSAQAENGIYVTAAGAWSRATDSNTAGELLVGYYYFVSSGSTQGSTGWTIQTAPATLGTDPVVFSQFSASASYSAGSGLNLIGNVFSNTGVRTITGTANEISASASTGTPILSLPSALTFTGKTVTGGTFNATGFNGPLGGTTPNTVVATTVAASTSGAGIVRNGFRNTSASSSAYNALDIGNDISSSDGEILVNSSTATGYGGARSMSFVTGSAVPIGFYPNNVFAGAFTTTGLNGAPVGATTPSTGAFTTLTGSSTATGSTTSRTLANRFAQVLNVKDFGAVGDGSTDDTTAIQAAFTAAVNGSCIFFPKASPYYKCTGITMPASLTNILVKGDQAQIYQPTNANNQLVIPATCSYVTVDGIWFNGIGSSRSNGIHIRTGADYTTIRNCRFEASSDWGIQVDSAGSAVKGFVCENNLFKDTLGDGCHVMNVDGFRISNNTFWQCGDDAIAALAQSTTVQPINGIISNNLIYGRTTAIAGANTHGFRGIVVFIGKNIVIEGNNIYNTYSAGIDVNDEYNSSLYNTNILITGNALYGCNQTAGAYGSIQAYFTNYSSITNNRVIDPATGSAIAIADNAVLTISGNTTSQSINQFFRGIVNNSSSTYSSRTIGNSGDISILSNTFNQTGSSNNESIYLVYTTGARCGQLIVADNVSRSGALAYITTDWIQTGKFVNNVTIGGTTAPSTGSNSSSITSVNNN